MEIDPSIMDLDEPEVGAFDLNNYGKSRVNGVRVRNARGQYSKRLIIPRFAQTRLHGNVGKSRSGSVVRVRHNLFSQVGAGQVDSVREAMYKRQRTSKAAVATTSSVNYEVANRSIKITGREYVATLTSAPTLSGTSTPFSTTSTLLRPTDNVLFSWLSAIARKFEEYQFEYLQFVYEPQCPTTTAGSVVLWFDGDPTHLGPANWNSVINTGANVHGAPWAKHVFVVPRHLFRGRKMHYVRAEFPDINQGVTQSVSTTPIDPLEYYCGLFGFGSVDVGAMSLPLGKVYLDYSVFLRTQSLEGELYTSLMSRVPVPCEAAINSGHWLTIRGGTLLTPSGTTLGLATTGNGCAIIGDNSAAAAASKSPLIQQNTFTGAVVAACGTQLFDIKSTSHYCIAKQDIDCLCNAHISLANNDMASVTFGVYKTASSVNYTSVCDSSIAHTNTAGYDAYLEPGYQTGNAVATPTIIGCGDVTVQYVLHLEKGDRFFIIVKGGSTLLGYELQFLPKPFGTVA